jgi:hypothetical protein
MTYTIDPKILINGVEYKAETINGVTLTAGRTTVDEQPRAGFASITLVTPDNTYPDIEIDYRVVVQVDNSAGTPVTLWTGWVSDVETTLGAFGATGFLNQQRITAVGSLSKLNRRLAGGSGYPKSLTVIAFMTLFTKPQAKPGQVMTLPRLGQMLIPCLLGRPQIYLLVT